MKSNFPVVSLGGHVRQISQRNKGEVDMEVFSVTNSEGFTRSTDYFSKEVFSKDVSNYKVVRRGQFAYNPSRINVGSIDYLKPVDRALVSPLYIVFETDPELYSDYLLRYLKSDWGNAQIRTNTEGAVRDSLKYKGLGRIKIPLPPLANQKRIAHLLGKVEGLIARRKQHLQQLDDLLRSVFLEMFSPHSPGYEVWPLVEIKDLAAKHKGAMRTGPFGSNLLHSEFTTEGDVAVLGIDNAVQNRFAWGERRFISNEKYTELQSYRIYPGDVIVTIMGTIGRSAVIPDDIPVAINTKHLVAITLNKEIANPLFISYSIHSSPFILNQFRSKNRGAIMSGLNLGLIKETKLKRPPIELQNQFAAIHTKIDEVKFRYQQSLTDLETLYGALSQKAFKGELDLARVPLPKIQTLPADDKLEQELVEPPQPEVDKLEPEQKTGPDQTELFNTWSFHKFLRARKDEVLTVSELWEAVQQKKFKNPPPTFESFKTWILTCLEQGEWLEQVYGVVSADKDKNRIEKKIALRIRDDS